MLMDAVFGRHWPGWDDLWVVFAFAGGVPLAVTVALGGATRAAVMATGAVWLWGAALFLLWFALG